MDFPDPVIELAIEPKSKADQEKLGQALGRLVQEDPTFRVSTDQETGQTVIKGMGELHLEIKVDILKRTYKVDANVGAPQVAYRETLGRRAEIDYTHKKQTGGSGQFARIKLVFEPGQPGSGYSFESKVVGGSVPKEYIPGVEKGLEASRETGVLAGFPVIDFKVTLIDGAYHDVDFERAGVRNRRPRGLQGRPAKAQRKLLEPIMKVEVVTPEDYMGDVHRRPEQPPRPDPGHGGARQRAGHQCDGPARQHVRLREHAAVDDPGTCALHHDVRSLRGRCRRRWPTRSSPSWPAKSFELSKEDSHDEGEI